MRTLLAALILVPSIVLASPDAIVDDGGPDRGSLSEIAASSLAPATRTKLDLAALRRENAVVAIGTVVAIGLDPTSRHPRVVALFHVDDAVAGTQVGETFTVVWSAPIAAPADLPQAGQKMVLFGKDGWDGLVRPTGGAFPVLPSSPEDVSWCDVGEELVPFEWIAGQLRASR